MTLMPEISTSSGRPPTEDRRHDQCVVPSGGGRLVAASTRTRSRTVTFHRGRDPRARWHFAKWRGMPLRTALECAALDPRARRGVTPPGQGGQEALMDSACTARRRKWSGGAFLERKIDMKIPIVILLCGFLALPALTPSALANDGERGGRLLDMVDMPAGLWQRCVPFPSVPPSTLAAAAAATVPASIEAGALQETFCFSHGFDCSGPCGDGLDIEKDVWQCKYDDDYDGVWDRYGPIWVTPTGWCCPPGTGWGW